MASTTMPPSTVELVTLRDATPADVPDLERLIAGSARELSAGDYTHEQIEAALLGAWGVDSQLIQDRTYFLGELGETVMACGGWSRRETRFGGDSYAGRTPRLLDPATEPARIRAFFVDPGWVRRGLGSLLLARCEAEARAAGSCAIELVATLAGERLYARRGYDRVERRRYELPGEVHIDFVSMRRSL